MFSMRIKWCIICVFAMLAVTMTSCKSDKAENEAVEPIPVIIDGDWGSSTDDLFALDVLEKAADEGRVEILAVMADREGVYNYGVMDLLNSWYGRPDTPMGIVSDAVKNPPVFIDYSKVLWDYRTAEGDSLKRSHTLEELEKLPDAVTVYREQLSKAEDNSVVIILLGLATNISHLLTSGPDAVSPLTGQELVNQKVKALYVMGGEFYSGNPEPDYNLKQDKANARILLDMWERPIIFSPQEVGQWVDYPGDLVLDDLKEQPLNPIRAVYEKCFTNTGQRMWDACVSLQLTDPELFELSEQGFAHLDDEMVVTFEPNPNGRDWYQKKLSDSGVEEVLKTIRDYAMRLPAKQ